ncbi:MAG: hypothetical protein M0Q91_10620 [Methanoregula sp.]|jgi:hypothetical protein|nr:hypothetical protein [Methanoregula sp.]
MIKLREVEDKDLLPLTEFLPRGFPYTTKDFWLPRFKMWWTDNPAYTPQFPRGWVLENDSTLVGFIGNIPVKFLVGGKERLAAASSSWYVDSSVRGMTSIRLFNEFLKQKDVSLFLFKAEDEQFIPILSRYQFEEYTLPKSKKEYVYIINRKKLDFNFSKFVFNKKIPGFSDLPELYRRTGFLISAYVFQKPVVQDNVPVKDAYTTTLCTSCDDSFYQIRKPVLDRCDVVVSHDTKTLTWLYLNEGRWFKRVVIQCHKSTDNTLAGFMVFDIERRKTSAAGNMRLVDMAIADPDPRVLSSLLSFAIETGKQQNATLLVVWANSPETDRYFQKMFSMRRAVQHKRYIRFSDAGTLQKGDHGNVCPSLIYPPQ